MNQRANFLYFNEGTDAANATGDGAMYRTSDFMGAVLTANNVVTLSFKSLAGTLTDDLVAVTLNASGVTRDYLKALASAMTKTKGGMLVAHSDFVGNNLTGGINNGKDHIYPHVSGIEITLG